MTFNQGKLPGVWIIDLAPVGQKSTSLTKVYDVNAYTAHGLNTNWNQHLTTYTADLGTIRGMHWQADPYPETKLIRCTRGRVFDVLVDIRPDSSTYCQWESYELSSECPQALYAPAGYAHGIQALEPDTEMSYLISAEYHQNLQRGCRWDDPKVGIEWPLENFYLSERDRELPAL